MMKLAVRILNVRYLNELKDYWTHQDYRALLELAEFANPEQLADEELKEMLYLAITDLEPHEAAEILLTYKLSNSLSKGQIQSIANEMMEDKVAEEYPEPELHYDLWNINQLLFKAFNGTFPNTEATMIEMEVHDLKADDALKMTEEIMTKLTSAALSEKNLLRRLYGDQLDGVVPFSDAAKFIWTLKETTPHTYQLLTSRYWIDKDDIRHSEYEIAIAFHKKKE